jgi:hypothetical protein
MPELLTPLPKTALDDAWLTVLDGRLAREVQQAGPGQCLRLDGLARHLLEALALRAAGADTAETYLVDHRTGPEPWRVGVHRVVARRNASERVVVAFVPPDVKLAAGDSVDVSTFRAIPTDGLWAKVQEQLSARLPAAVREAALQILSYLDKKGWPVQPSARLRFLATIAHQERPGLWAVGGALHTLGLIPDFELLDHPDQLGYRLGQRNLPNVQLLAASDGTLLERLLRLPLSDEGFRRRLGELLLQFDGQGIEAWGEAIATTPRSRPLALERWPLADRAAPTDQVRVDLDPLRLPRRQDDDLLLYDAAERLVVAWKSDPPPGDAPGLAFFRVEVVDADGHVAWETDLIKAIAGRQAKRSKQLKNLGLPSGIYFVRVVPLSEHGDPLGIQPSRDPALPDGKRTNESDDFLLREPDDIDEDVPPAVTTTIVGSFAEAELLARLGLASEGRDPGGARPLERSWLTGLGASSETAMASVRFDSRRQYKVRLSQRLRRLELAILAQPGHGGHCYVALAPASAAPLKDQVESIELPTAVADARARVFEAINTMNVVGEEAEAGRTGRPAGPVVALADLCGMAPLIERYAAAYADWLDSGDPASLLLDLVLIDVEGVCRAALLAPTHPLRLLWLLQRQQLARAWSDAAATRRDAAGGDILQVWRSAIPASGLPSLLVTPGRGEFIEAADLPGGWGAYLPPRLPDSRAALSLLQQRVGIPAATPSGSEAVGNLIAGRLEAFTRQHPYVDALVINVINPGDAALMVDALVDLERRLGTPASMRYELRLFTGTADPALIGDALRQLMDPDRQLSEWAARLAAPGRSPLFPKLTWSRKQLSELIEHPERFSAHVTLILDAFPVRLFVGQPGADDRSSFVHGLVQAPPVRFAGHGANYRWIRRPDPSPCPELPGAPGRSSLLARLVAGIAATQARVLAPGNHEGAAVAVTGLRLTTEHQSLLYTAHTISTWVMTLDSNLGVEYFDSSDRHDRPGYLLDFTPEFVPSGGQQLLLTTRAGDELMRLVLPLAEQLGLERESSAGKLLIEAMRALSGRLALRLLTSPSQAQGALGMALTKLFCEGYGLLTEAMAIPLDAHPELSRRETGPALRGDLVVVFADPERRHLDMLVVETKCHAGTGLDAGLRARIREQVTSSATALRESFQIAESGDRIDRQALSWRLSTVLSFYAGRAERYGLITPAESAPRRRFLADLDRGYSLSVRTMGLVFRLDAATTKLDEEEPELPVWVVGRDVIDRLLTEGMRRLAISEDATQPPSSLRDAMSDQPTWEQVRTTFGRPVGSVTAPSPEAEPVDATPPATQEPSTPPAADRSPTRDGMAASGEADAGLDVPSGDQPAVPQFGVLLGDSQPTRQFGLLGTVAAEDWKRVALDLNGCNTISVFGVQGGGKSYTLGAVLEMAARPIPGINLLPQPLASVVFHYHQTQDYPPEFVSMVQPNEDPDQVKRLGVYGATPAAVPDVLLLSTADTVDRRRMEFPGIRVEPIGFASKELTVADWRFLMGATGNDALYLKILNEVMRAHRRDLTLSAIHAGLAAANLSATQRALAETRLEFAARFIDDSRSLRSLLVPGRVVIVDLRDEFIEQDEALGLFVTMLNVFSGAGMGADRFNKLIVFDEAHKYLGGQLIDQVVEVIREMRHKGVSLVIASQDPVHVPPAVIELSSAVIVHRINAPSWLKHIQKSLAALGDLTPPMLAGLAPGEAFVWANRATSGVFTRRAVKLRMRPRVSRHGGSTRLAVEP